LVLAATPLAPGDHARTLQVDGRERSYLVHTPPKYDPKQPTPVVLILHGAGTNAQIMVRDDLATVVNVDPKRVFATGMSNGGMMCYRLASELSDRIAAIAPVSGTMAIPDYKPKRPVPVIHFHGTADNIVPFNGPKGTPKFLTFKSVEETIRLCAKTIG